MTLFGAVRAKKCLVTVLLLGLIWQMGACPCGCIEHNLWLQLLGWVAGQTPIAQRNLAVGSDSSENSVSAVDCHHRPRDSFVRERTAGEDERAAYGAVHAVPLASPPDLKCQLSHASGSSPGRDRGRASFFDAQKVRAHLQVFQI
jgi:hypothetical protein